MNDFNLSGKRALVTGASGLLGRKHCEALLEAGARVALADLNSELVHAYAEELGEKTLPLYLDVTKKDNIEAACLEILKQWDGIDILVNNAAINDKVENSSTAPSPSTTEAITFEAFPQTTWQTVLDVNLTGTFLCAQVFGREMARQRSGSIINIASTYGLVAPDQRLYLSKEGHQKLFKSVAYCTTKGAILSLTRYLATYWAPKNVRVNTLVPGGVENGQEEFFIQAYAERTPLQRMAKPTDFRGALIYLASDASSYMTGTEIIVDGGWTAW